jgi:hypothetical protein
MCSPAGSHEDGGSKHFWNVSLLQGDYTAVYPRNCHLQTKQNFLTSSLWNYHFSYTSEKSHFCEYCSCDTLWVTWRTDITDGQWSISGRFTDHEIRLRASILKPACVPRALDGEWGSSIAWIYSNSGPAFFPLISAPARREAEHRSKLTFIVVFNGSRCCHSNQKRWTSYL